MMDLNPAFAIP